MPKPAHTRVTWSGVFGSVAAPVEEWSFGLNIGQSVLADQAARQAAAIACRDAFSSRLMDEFLNVVVFTRCRVAQIDGTGRTLLDANGGYLHADATSTQAGTAGVGAIFPLQTSLVVSLKTARAGATGKGRCFLPPPAVTLQSSDMRMPEARAQTIATKFAGFITAVDAVFVAQDNDPSTGEVCVVSSKGYASKVTGVRVGRVLDTMRSRRGRQEEGYVEAVVANG